jgi:hypothetical protein
MDALAAYSSSDEEPAQQSSAAGAAAGATTAAAVKSADSKREKKSKGKHKHKDKAKAKSSKLGKRKLASSLFLPAEIQEALARGVNAADSDSDDDTVVKLKNVHVVKGDAKDLLSMLPPTRSALEADELLQKLNAPQSKRFAAPVVAVAAAAKRSAHDSDDSDAEEHAVNDATRHTAQSTAAAAAAASDNDDDDADAGESDLLSKMRKRMEAQSSARKAAPLFTMPVKRTAAAAAAVAPAGVPVLQPPRQRPQQQYAVQHLPVLAAADAYFHTGHAAPHQHQQQQQQQQQYDYQQQAYQQQLQQQQQQQYAAEQAYAADAAAAAASSSSSGRQGRRHDRDVERQLANGRLDALPAIAQPIAAFAAADPNAFNRFAQGGGPAGNCINAYTCIH